MSTSSKRSRPGSRRETGIHWERWLVRSVLFVLLFPVLLVLVLRWVPPPMTSFMLGTKLHLIEQKAKDTRIRYRWVDYDHIAPEMKLAAMAAEDQRFPEHSGFDWQAIGMALQYNQENARVRGASTISQQVAKNLFLWGDRSWVRKGIETYLTFWLELLWPKQRILEMYLNVAQFGPTVFGVGAAAPIYFDRTASRLTASQSALLAAVLPAPTRFKVVAPSYHVRARQGWILRQMRQLGTGRLQDVQATQTSAVRKMARTEPVQKPMTSQRTPAKPAAPKASAKMPRRPDAAVVSAEVAPSASIPPAPTPQTTESEPAEKPAPPTMEPATELRSAPVVSTVEDQEAAADEGAASAEIHTTTESAQESPEAPDINPDELPMPVYGVAPPPMPSTEPAELPTDESDLEDSAADDAAPSETPSEGDPAIGG